MKNENLRIHRYYSIIGHSPNTVELRYGVWNPVSFILTDETGSGRLYKLLTLLDGTKSVAELAKEAGLTRSDVEAVLDHLREIGVLEKHTTTSSLDYYLDYAIPGLKSATNQKDQQLKEILILGDNDINNEIARYVKGSITNIPVTVVDGQDRRSKLIFGTDTSWLRDGIEFRETVQLFEPWKDRLVVMGTKVIHPVAFKTLNRVSLYYQIPWFHATLDGPFVFVGPMIIPNRSSCYECFETRVTMNIRESTSYQRYKNALTEGNIKYGELPIEPAVKGMLAAHTTMEIVNYYLTGSTFTIQKVMATYLPTMEISYNDVLRVSSCPACGSIPDRDDKELFYDTRILSVGRE